jgi:hypothetical protein
MDARSLRSMILQTARRRGLFVTTQLFRARPDWKGGSIGIRFEQAAEPQQPKQPHASEANLDKVFNAGQVAIPPENRRPFTDQQWIDYFTEAFGVFRPGNPTFEVDPDTGVMKIEINPEPDDD